jgi:hypothetical protein
MRPTFIEHRIDPLVRQAQTLAQHDQRQLDAYFGISDDGLLVACGTGVGVAAPCHGSAAVN